jgi:hypothetical protein
MQGTAFSKKAAGFDGGVGYAAREKYAVPASTGGTRGGGPRPTFANLLQMEGVSGRLCITPELLYATGVHFCLTYQPGNTLIVVSAGCLF